MKLALTLGALAGVACGAPPPAVSPGPATTVSVEAQIVGTRCSGTARELRDRGTRASLAMRWVEAADCLEALYLADRSGADAGLLYDLAVAMEGAGRRSEARDRMRELYTRYPADPNARAALMREATLDAYLEDWASLGAVGDRILSRSDIDDVERMLGLGARGLSRIELGDEQGASRDISQGLDLVDLHHYGATGRLPVAVAQLKFAHGELRRVRSEKIALSSEVPSEFVVALERRCQGLLDAQTAYADAIRSVDPYYAQMSGYRVGEMYQSLHAHLMKMPPPPKAKTESDRQLFFGIMHLRYRVLVEKGLEMMRRTIELSEKLEVENAWSQRAVKARAAMETTLEAEKKALSELPFTTEEIEKAMALMKQRAEASASKPVKNRAN